MFTEGKKQLELIDGKEFMFWFDEIDSDDGGIRCHCSDEEMNKKMEMAASKLNIKGHRVGLQDEIKFIYGPTDIGK